MKAALIASLPWLSCGHLQRQAGQAAHLVEAHAIDKLDHARALRAQREHADIGVDPRHAAQAGQRITAFGDQLARSEEHTSELQSLMRISYAVFCLKKKHKQKP